MGRVGLIQLQKAAAAPVTGLDFNLFNGDSASNIRFSFTGSNCIQRYPRTQIWKIFNRQQAGYYTTFFRTSFLTASSFSGDGSYEGCHLYPYPTSTSAGTVHHEEISADGTDSPLTLSGLDDNGASTLLSKGVWRTMALRARIVSTNLVLEHFYGLPDLTKKITVTIAAGNIVDHGGNALVYGSSPWTESGVGAGSTNTETLAGILRGLQNYSEYLNDTDLPLEAATPLSTATGIANIHYLNLNPTPADISDKSSAGHHPTWNNANRPTLYSA